MKEYGRSDGSSTGRPQRYRHRRQQGSRPGDRRGILRVGRQRRDPGARSGRACRSQAQIQAAAARGRSLAISCDVSKADHQAGLRTGHLGIRQGRHLRQQRRPVDPRAFRDYHRRDVAGRSRPQAVRPGPLLPHPDAADEERNGAASSASSTSAPRRPGPTARRPRSAAPRRWR